MDFAQPVSFQYGDGIVERGLLSDEGRISGRAQSAVRLLSSVDLDRILALGLNDDEPLLHGCTMF
jgi:putative restriction endonuclease